MLRVKFMKIQKNTFSVVSEKKKMLRKPHKNGKVSHLVQCTVENQAGYYVLFKSIFLNEIPFHAL